MKFFLLCGLAILCSCQMIFKKDNKRIQALNDMQQTDVDFSAYSREHGMRKAFLKYIEDDGVLLRPNHLPIIGADAIEYLASINDSTVELTWEPAGGNVSESGDLGYTYGTYIMSDSGTEIHGTYVTIWQKKKDGSWKFVLDTGNQGIGEEKAE